MPKSNALFNDESEPNHATSVLLRQSDIGSCMGAAWGVHLAATAPVRALMSPTARRTPGRDPAWSEQEGGQEGCEDRSMDA